MLKRKLLIRLVVIAVITFALVLGTVPLLGTFWHLLHGDTISFAGQAVPVPKGFYVRQTPSGPAMWKQSIGRPFLSAPYAHISLFYRPRGDSFAFDKDRDQFKTQLAQDASEEGYNLSTEQTISLGEKRAYCLEFSRSSPNIGSLVRCAIDGSAIVVFYEGDSRYVRDMQTVLRGIARN